MTTNESIVWYEYQGVPYIKMEYNEGGKLARPQGLPQRKLSIDGFTVKVEHNQLRKADDEIELFDLEFTLDYGAFFKGGSDDVFRDNSILMIAAGKSIIDFQNILRKRSDFKATLPKIHGARINVATMDEDWREGRLPADPKVMAARVLLKMPLTDQIDYIKELLGQKMAQKEAERQKAKA